MTPTSVVLTPFDGVTVKVTGVVKTQYLNSYTVQMPSGGYFYFSSDGNCYYHAGPNSDVTDIVWITYHNGCGTTHTEFRATVQAP